MSEPASSASELGTVAYLRGELLRLRTALSFYAEKANWRRGKPAAAHGPRPQSAVVQDRGSVARHALRPDR